MTNSVKAEGFKSYRGQKELCLADVNQLYYDGDTIQFWSGLVPEKEREQKAFWQWLQRVFHSYNITQEGIDHYVNALVGQDFTYTIEGKNAEEAEEILKKWWKWQQKSAIKQALSHGEPIKDAVLQMLVRDRGDGSGVGYLRLFQPEKYKSFDGAEAYKKYVLHTPCAGSVCVKRDDDNFIEEIEHSHGEKTYKYKLRDDGKCEITTSYQSQEENKKPVVIDLGGRFPIFPLNGKCLITEDTKQIQNSINHALTMKDVNVSGGGFRERYIINAQKQGSYHPDPQSPGRRKFVPDPNAKISLGAGSIVQLTGNKIGDQNNPTAYTEPKVEIADPVSIAIFADSVLLDCQTFYYHFSLAHLLSAGDGNVSGRARLGVKGDYLANLRGYEDNIEGALSNVMESVLILIDKDKFSDIEVTTNLTLSFDLIPEMINVYATMIETGLICKEKAIEKLGNPNAKEELEKILEERRREIESDVIPQDFVKQYQPNE